MRSVVARRTAPSPRSQETSVLLHALGEFLLFLERENRTRRLRNGRKQRSENDDEAPHLELKRAVLEWVRGLSDDEWTSLCTVVDVGFVKTVLAMGMAAKAVEDDHTRRRRGCSVMSAARGSVTLFQLLPTDTVVKRMTPSTQQREFLRRPVACTCDGDALTGFHSHGFVGSCAFLLKSLCVLNTTRSCDTLTIADYMDNGNGIPTRAEWLRHMDVLSGGCFLRRRPSDREVQHRPVWEQTAWFASRGSFTLAELVANQIEMSIWFHFTQRQKQQPTLYQIPMSGAATKQLLAHEWRSCCVARQQDALRSAALHLMAYLKQLPPPNPTTGARMIAKNPQLTTLLDLLEAWQRSCSVGDQSSTAVLLLFAQPLNKILCSPQSAAVGFLLAELMQEECAKILSENMAASLEQQLLGGANQGEVALTKSTHAQRRRAARKKAVKERKHANESRSAHETQLQRVLDELLRAVKVWQQRVVNCVGEVIDEIVDAVVAASVEAEAPAMITGEEKGVEAEVCRPKRRKKKRGKKKNKKLKDDDDDDGNGDAPTYVDRDGCYRGDEGKVLVLTTTKENVLPNQNETPPPSSSIAVQPLLSFLTPKTDNNNDHHQHYHGHPASSSHYASPRPSTPFSTHSFYTMASSPFFLPLSSHHEVHHAYEDEVYDDGEDDDDYDYDHGHTTANSKGHRYHAGGTAAEPPTSFDWYLPSLFSSQSSVHTTSTVSSLDWDFQKWSMKTDAPSVVSSSSTTAATAPSLLPLPAFGPQPQEATAEEAEEAEEAETEAASLSSSSSSLSPARGSFACPAAVGSPCSPMASAAAAARPTATNDDDVDDTDVFPLPSFSTFVEISNGNSSITKGGRAPSPSSPSSMIEPHGGQRDESKRALPIRKDAHEDKHDCSICDGDDDDGDHGGGFGRSDFLYQEGGFFDRQRGSKRRRRPFPFEYDDDDDDDDDEEENDENGEDGDEQDGPRHPSQWPDGTKSRRTQSRRIQRRSRRPRYSTAPSSHACACHRSHTESPAKATEEESAASSKLVADRVTKLERLLEDRLTKSDQLSSTMATEMESLQKQVTVLSGRIKSLEKELVDFQRATSTSTSSTLSAPSLAASPDANNTSEAATAAVALSDTPASAMTAASQRYPHPIMRPGGASNYSILGPFVSVPMAVLPPRSKLHWDMCEYVSQLQTDANARVTSQMAAIRFCTAAVQSLWPRAQVRPYGSFVTRLALPTSDVDLVICLPKVRRDAPADAAGVLEGRNAIKESWQQNLARKLCQEPWVVADSVKTIPHAAIPIITLVTTLPFNVRLDISFEGPGHNGLATNGVVLSLIHEFPPLAPIMLVLKSFVIERGFAVAYSGGLSSYALLLMVARYLQEHTDCYDHGGDTTATVTVPATSSASASSSSVPSSPPSAASCADFGMVLMGLLDFYGNRFDPRTTGISVASRCFFNRDSISTTVAAAAAPGSGPGSHHIHSHSSQSHSTHHQHQATAVDHGDHWQQMNQSSHTHNNANLLSSPGSRRHSSNRSSLHDYPMQRVADAVQDDPSTATSTASGVAHDPHKFDPLFIEDPLHASNNVGRNCFRISQIRRTFSSGYTMLMAASMAVSVFSDNRSTIVGGVALHPDNILRSILGAHAPPAVATSRSNSNSVPTSGKSGAASVAAAVYQPTPKPRGASQYHPYHQQAGRPVSSGSAAARLVPGAMPFYDHQQIPGAPAPPYYTTSVGGPSVPPPYMLHRMQMQMQMHSVHPHHQHIQPPQQQQQQQQQYQYQYQYQHQQQNQHQYAHHHHNHNHQYAHHYQQYVASKPQPRQVESSSTTSSAYRRHSGSVTEQMTTRSEAASSSADKYYVKRPTTTRKPTDRGLAHSPRLMPPTMHRSSSIELDKKATTSHHHSGDDASGTSSSRGLTRKIPSRSMSFADVVMSGHGTTTATTGGRGGAAATTTTAKTDHHQRKAPSSPLALVRSTASWRRQESHGATATEEASSFNERLETKDDFELK